MGEQIKIALKKLKEYWASLSPLRRKTIVLLASVVAVVALGLVVFMNFSGASMTLLYEGLESGESVEIYNALKELGISSRLSATGQVEVRRADKDRAIGQLAMQNYPKSALPYQYFTGGSGLTTTDMERREYQKQGLQDRLQATIRQYDGVKNVVVTIDVPKDTSYPWSGSTQTSSASVSLVLNAGYTPTPDQVSGIKYLVSKSVGQNMAPANVAVIDAATWVNLKSREDSNLSGVDAESERLMLQEKVEQTLVDKARNVLSIAFSPEDMGLSATVAFDYSKLVTESKEYRPSEDSANNTGVLEHQDKNYIMDGAQLAQGVAGEEDNTDTVPGYVDQDGDGTPDIADFSLSQDFAVGYIMQQIEKNNAEMVSASMAIMIRGALAAPERDTMIEIVAKATGIDEDNISIQSVEIGEPENPVGSLPTLTQMIPYFAIIIGLILLLLIFMILASRRSKKKKDKGKNVPVREVAPPREPTQTQEEWQMELEDHKRQLMDAAKGTKKEEAIITEVREFAQDNPEITAGLLRSWLKEEDE